MANIKPIDPIEVLRERFGKYVYNDALSHYRNRALPNNGEPTNEEEVNSFMQQDDETEFVRAFKSRLSENP